MKKNFAIFLDVALCFCVIFLFLANRNLNKKLDIMDKNFNSRIEIVERNFPEIYKNVEDRLKSYSDIVVDYGYEFKYHDIKTGIVGLYYHLTPKEVLQGVTKAVLVCGEDRYDMEYNNGQFEAVFPISLYKNFMVDKVEFYENDVLKTYILNDGFNPRKSFITNINIEKEYGCMTSFDNSKKEFRVVFDTGAIKIDVYKPGKGYSTEIKSLDIVTYIDEIETSRKDIMNTEEANNFYIYEMREKFTIPTGKDFKICVEIMDEDDILHKCIIYHCKFGNSAEEFYSCDDLYENLYDKEGNILSDLT